MTNSNNDESLCPIMQKQLSNQEKTTQKSTPNSWAPDFYSVFSEVEKPIPTDSATQISDDVQCRTGKYLSFPGLGLISKIVLEGIGKPTSKKDCPDEELGKSDQGAAVSCLESLPKGSTSALYLCPLILLAWCFYVGFLLGLKAGDQELQTNFGTHSNSTSSGSGTFSPNRNSTEILVGAYYYPWHGNNFHNGQGYIRQKLDPPQMPTLGEYDDTKPETIATHLKWSRQANIGLWVTSWWGPNRLEDLTTRDVILQHKELGEMMVALHYETTGRIRGDDVDNVSDDMAYICENYFPNKNYLRINGRPVIFVYITRQLERDNLLFQTVADMRSAIAKCGENLFIVGDHVFREAPNSDSNKADNMFMHLDAVNNYDVYGSMGSTLFAGSAAVDDYYREQGEWKNLAAERGCRYIPTVSPGFNDRGVRPDVNRYPLSRRLTANSAEGSLFEYAIKHATKLVDSGMQNLLLVNSFNEWHEDTQIEPCTGEATSYPGNLTLGQEYKGYDTLYLDILRRGTTNASKAVTTSAFRANNIFAGH